MKCPHCGVDSSVLDTRKFKEVFLYRRRKCFNEHVFATYEVFVGNVDQRTLAASQRGITARSKASKLKKAIISLPLDMSSEIAASFVGCSGAYVRLVRKTHRE